jgi:hypothetical protein
MRLTVEQVRQGLCHEDPLVRSFVLLWQRNRRPRDAAAMPMALEALARYGTYDCFEHVYPLAELTQTPASIAWALEQLASVRDVTDANEPAANLRDALVWLLSGADLAVSAPYCDQIEAALTIDSVALQVFRERRELATWDADRLWQELEALSARHARDSTFDDVPYERGCRLAAALAQHGPPIGQRAQEALRAIPDDLEQQPEALWLELWLVRLAGLLRWEPVVPVLLDRLRFDSDLLNEECGRALAEIGTDHVADAVTAVWAAAEWHVRLYCAAALERIDTDRALEAALRLAESEEDSGHRSRLLQAALWHCCSDANQAARAQLLRTPRDRELHFVADPVFRLMGEEPLPELPPGGRAIPGIWGPSGGDDLKECEVPAWGTLPDDYVPAEDRPEPLRAGPKVGRNEPCPCGSGKKFKKCCLRAATTK